MVKVIRKFYFYPLVLSALSLGAGPHDVLEDYVDKPDDAYRWSIEHVEKLDDMKHLVVDLNSQSWLDEKTVNRSVWKHWLRVYVPEEPTTNVAMLFIGGGKNQSEVPTNVLEDFALLAKVTQTIVVYLGQVPNQPLMFEGNPFPIREDALVAYSWRQYFENGDQHWIVNLPMVKSVVRAMDATTEFLRTEEAGGYEINEFVVSGGSKRGWTTWLTAAIDDRVKAIIPIVFDALKFEDSLHNHFKSYGYWSPALADYAAEGLLQKLGTDEVQDLFIITDPYEYRKDLELPKYLINSAGDEFFPVDSARFYFNDLIGDKYLRYIPNTDHSMSGSDVNESMATFLWLIANKKEVPSFDWNWESDSELKLSNYQGTISQINLFSAYNDSGRDFRMLRESDDSRFGRGPLWTKDTAYKKGTELPILGEWSINSRDSDQSWQAHMVEVVFDVGFQYPFKLTTNVMILSDRRPFEDKSHRQESHLTINCASLENDVSARILDHLKNDVGTKYAVYQVVDGRDYYTWLPVQDIRIEGRNVGSFLESVGYSESDCFYQIEAGKTPTITVKRKEPR